MICFRIILASIAILSGTSRAYVRADLIVNGSFESPNIGSPNRVSIATLTNWNATGGFMLLERGVNGTSNISAFHGQQFVSMGHSGASNDRLFQTVTTVVGQTYDLTFNLASIQGTAAQIVRASAFNASNSEFAFTDSGVTTQNVWASNNLRFTAESISTRIEFRHTLAAGVANVAIDNVQLNQVTAVPESSSAVLFLLSTMTLAANRIRIKRPCRS